MKKLRNNDGDKAGSKKAKARKPIRLHAVKKIEFSPVFRREKIDEQSKFELAKYVLLAIVFVYISLVIIVLYLDAANYLKEVWAVSICLINTTIGIIIGYYFSKR